MPIILISVENKRITFITKRKIPITTKQNKSTAKKNTNLKVFSIKLNTQVAKMAYFCATHPYPATTPIYNILYRQELSQYIFW